MSSSSTTVGDLVTFVIKVQGSAIADSYSVYSVHVEKSINRIALAEVVILDGSASQESFTASSSSDFVPGNKITIEAGYNNSNAVIFDGIIVGQNLRVDNTIGSALTVQCKDEAIKMTIGRNSACFNEQTDSDVMSSLIGNSGLSADVSSTSTSWPQLVQYYASDWDFMLCRAQVNAMVVATINGKVKVFAPGDDTSSVETVTYGENLYNFQGDLNAITQLGNVKAQSWDPETQAIVSGSASNTVAGPGNISSKTLSEVVGPSEFLVQTSAPLPEADLTQWAKGQMVLSEYSKIEGEVKFQGSSNVEPGVYVTVAGMGDRFNGDHFVAKIVHEIEEGNWFCYAHLGISAKWFATEPDVVAPSASGLLPGINGLYNATVKKIFDDPTSSYRILIDLPLLDPAGDGLWARLTNFYSTDGQGVFFLPEVGDEVIVGFTNNDPRYPVILGSVYSAKRKPWSQLSPNEENSTKAIVTKSELRVVFDDEKKILTVTTPENNMVELNDESKQVTVKDQNGNSMVMSESGIDIKSPKTINISADDTVNIKGQMGVNIEASSGDVSVKGLNVEQSASVNYQAKGGAEATVEGGASLTLKAAMVMIN